jgi:hypothetical protein
MQPILYILVGVIRHVLDRKGWPWVIALIICCLVIYAGIYFVFVPRDVDYPENPPSPEYERNLHYLLNASMQAPRNFSNIRGSFLGTHLAIVDEQDFALLTKKLRYDLLKAADNDFFFHSFVLGGMNVFDIDQPLLKATKRLRISSRCKIEIILVDPTTVSAETKSILEKRGLKIRLIDAPSRDSLR